MSARKARRSAGPGASVLSLAEKAVSHAGPVGWAKARNAVPRLAKCAELEAYWTAQNPSGIRWVSIEPKALTHYHEATPPIRTGDDLNYLLEFAQTLSGS
jgi:hypothetical protein